MILKGVIRDLISEYSGRKKLGNILVDMGAITKDDLTIALASAEVKSKDVMLGEYLINNHYITEETLDKALKIQLGSQITELLNESTDEAILAKAEQFGFTREAIIKRLEKKSGVTYVDLNKYDIKESVINSLFNIEIMQKNNLIPFEIDNENKIWKFASADIGDSTSLKARTKAECAKKGIKCEFYFAFDFEIQRKYRNLHKAVEIKVKADDEQGAIDFVNNVISDAILKDASDIHIEPKRNGLRVRYRIDGLISKNDFYEMDASFAKNVISRIKIMASMDIAISRKPQDGIIRDFEIKGKIYDLRVSSIQVIHGEKIVIRIAPKNEAIKTFEDLGFLPKDIEKLNNIIHKTTGIFFIAGATGSGKTTTLYSIIDKVNNPTVNICTIEDPIEREIDGINQVQASSQDGNVNYKFADYLRVFLRQDPDIIVVGETRDSETADTAMRASLTGHFVLTTIHANNAIETISRMYDMDIDTYILSATLEGVMSQRLVRRVCSHCAIERELTADEKLYIEYLNKKNNTAIHIDRVREGKGCDACNNTGYRGRIVIAEVVEMDSKIKEMIRNKVPTDDIEAYLIQNGFSTMEVNGLMRVEDGTTNIQELQRVL